ncbi:sodium pump decarboxylase gamma subunit [Natranaerovirga hydrolytica]|uniref:Sodium pump decarboxylase gamma subunit n=1 Tax=Natranaerovirga hydrolytica TaxID=680378 RepID=A0A4R1MXJ3_9FIRM|nr:OadG family protein [Natranaerovirga hydrolytica]TCK97988.1 sodium pump decarboxylase gamma subunit [Natranaerovirga hydrolytica]
MDTLINALGVTAVGMGIVFAMLIIISVIIANLRHVNNLFAKQPKKQEVVKETKVETPVVKEESVDDLELVAVITSAIAASLNTTSDQLQVKSIRRVKTKKTKWQYQ